MSETQYQLQITGGGKNLLVPADVKRTVTLPSIRTAFSAYLTPAEFDGEITHVALISGDDVLYSVAVPPGDGGLLGADAEISVAAKLDGCADAGDALLDVLTGISGSDVGLDCITSDGSRTALTADLSRSSGKLILTASLPENARLAVVTCGGNGAVYELSQLTESVSETVQCITAGYICTAVAESASASGARTRSMPAGLADVRTYPDMPPAEKLRAFGKALVAFGYGRVSVIVDGAVVTERAAGNITGVWAADDGTLAYVSDGRATFCRGGDDFFTTDAVAAVITGTGSGAVMHVLGGGSVRGITTSGTQAYARSTEAFALATFAGDVAELTENGTAVYSPSGSHIVTKQHIYAIDSVVSCFDGGFEVTATAGEESAVCLITPYYIRVLGSGFTGFDGLLIAKETQSGVSVYDASGVGMTEVGSADSSEIAFTDALYSVTDDGRVTRRAATSCKALLMSHSFAAGENYGVTGEKYSRGAGIVTLTIQQGG